MRTPGDLQAILDLLDEHGVDGGKPIEQTRAYLARAGSLKVPDHVALKAGIVEDLATGRATVEDVEARVATMRTWHALSATWADPNVIAEAGSRCMALAWESVRKAGPAIDKQTRDRVTAINTQLGKLADELPVDMRGESVPASASRAAVGAWSDLVDARRRLRDLQSLRARLRAAELVEATPDEQAAEDAAEAFRLAVVGGQLPYSMTTESARGFNDHPLASGLDTLIVAR